MAPQPAYWIRARTWINRLPHDLASEQLERLWIYEKHRHDMNIHTISGSCPELMSIEAASHLYSCSGLPKGLFTWRWQTPGRWGNPPLYIFLIFISHDMWGNHPSRVALCARQGNPVSRGCILPCKCLKGGVTHLVGVKFMLHLQAPQIRTRTSPPSTWMGNPSLNASKSCNSSIVLPRCLSN